MIQAVTSPKIWIVDACSALNLAASGRIQEVLSSPIHGQQKQYTMAEVVIQEAVGLRRGGTGEDANMRDPIDWNSYFVQGWLQYENDPTATEQEEFVRLTAHIDDGEAMTLALAASRGYGVVTDDRKAQKMLSPGLFLDTPMIFENWSRTASCSPAILGDALRKIAEHARFFPPRNHPLKNWWDKASKT